jgi:hypothetical protein
VSSWHESVHFEQVSSQMSNAGFPGTQTRCLKKALVMTVSVLFKMGALLEEGRRLGKWLGSQDRDGVTVGFFVGAGVGRSIGRLVVSRDSKAGDFGTEVVGFKVGEALGLRTAEGFLVKLGEEHGLLDGDPEGVLSVGIPVGDTDG